MSREEEPHIDTNMNTVCEPDEEHEEENDDSAELREEHARDRRGRNDEDEE